MYELRGDLGGYYYSKLISLLFYFDILLFIGKADAEGNYVVTYGALFKDDEVANTFEGLSATLKNAKTKKIVNYNSPLLLQGAHDNVEITLFAAHAD